MDSFEWLSDRSDHRVAAALDHSCGLCAVPAGVDCIHPVRGQTLSRIVHLARVMP